MRTTTKAIITSNKDTKQKVKKNKGKSYCTQLIFQLSELIVISCAVRCALYAGPIYLFGTAVKLIALEAVRFYTHFKLILHNSI